MEETGFSSARVRPNHPEQEYWREKLAGVTAVEGFPVDFFETAGRTPIKQAIDFTFPEALSQRLMAIGNRSPAAVFLLLLSGVFYLTYRYTGNEDQVVGMPALKQKGELSPIKPLVPLRCGVSGRFSFREFLTEVKQMVNEAVKHQNFPGSMMVELLNQLSNGVYGSSLPVMVTLENLHGLNPSIGKTPTPALAFNFKMTETTISLHLEYEAALYTPATLVRIQTHLLAFFKTVANDPGVRLAEIEILSAVEKSQLLSDFNQTKVPYPTGRMIHELLEAQALRTPERPALVCGGHQISYRELNERADRLAGFLRRLGAQPEEIVAMMVERSPEMVIGIFGVLKAGGAYLPVDPGYPEERIAYLLADSGTKILLTQRRFKSEVHFQGETVYLDDPIPDSDEDATPAPRSSSGNLAYIIYTSGSTGRPKGVMIEHRSVVNLLSALQEKYPLKAPDSYLLKTSYTFDVSVAELFGWFHDGGRLVILAPGAEKEPRRILETIAAHQVTHINFVPSMLKVFLESLSEEDLPALNRLQYVFVAGEALPRETVSRFHRLFGASRRESPIRFENIYGPTEITIYATSFPLEHLPDAINVPIGTPLPNVQALIMDQNHRLQPVGIPGELYITGAGLARGYLNRPELTAEKFVRAIHNEECIMHNEERLMHNEERRSIVNFKRSRTNETCDFNYELCIMNSTLYKTGDLARWLPDGNIEFLGRIDHQVKIRGFRVELGEIENLLLRHDGIREAVVVARDEDGVTAVSGTKYLCAYLVTRQELLVGEIREYLGRQLPEYMIPTYFIFMAQLPLNSNGKIDRKALPGPEGLFHTGVDYVPPTNALEAKLAVIWQEVLGIGKIGMKDNFFMLGGHSLKATAIIQRIGKELKADLAISAFLKHPVIPELARLIVDHRENDYQPMVPIPENLSYPLSSVQKRLFIVSQMEGAGVVYNVPVLMEIRGRLERTRLEEALRRLVARHEILRTAFIIVNDEPRQQITPEIDFRMDYREVSEAQIEDAINQFIGPFDLSQAPLFRVILLRNTGEGAVECDRLLFDIHHLIFDGISLEILERDLIYLYDGKELPELKVQYKDFTAWQNQFFKTALYQRQAQYWLDHFAQGVLNLSLPADHPRPLVQSFAGAHLHFALEAELADGIRRLAAQTGTTLFMTLLSAFQILIAKYTGQTEILTGAPVAGRRHPDVSEMIGMFVNTIVLKNTFRETLTYSEFLEEVKENSLKAYEHQDYQFEDLVEQLDLKQDRSRNPLFDLMFVLQTSSRVKAQFDGLEAHTRELKTETAKFDLTLEVTEAEEQLQIDLEYSSALFRPETIHRLGGHYQNILRRVALNPAVKLAELEILTEEEKRQILIDFNGAKTHYPRGKTITQLFEEQAAQSPNQVAVGAPGQPITYRELNRLANGLSRVLRGKGVKPGWIVGLMVERSPEMIVGMLGILKAGGAYLPINPDYPSQRVRFMLEDSQAEILLSRAHWAEKAGPKVTTIDLDGVGNSGDEASNPEAINQPTDLAYIIYTSGSTGVPKGVMVEHRNVVRLVKNTNYIEFSPQDRILQTGAAVFDATTFEVWGSLLNGGSLYLVADEVILNAARLSEALKDYRISTLWLTAPLFNQLVEEDEEGNLFRSLKYLLVGGDVLSPKHIHKVRRQNPGLKVINGYGPTENTTFTACFLIDADYPNIPIGKPISNSTVYILGSNGQPQPVGVWGELYTGGDGVARGYLNRPELTGEKFVLNPFHTASDGASRGTPPTELYKTGDLARWLTDGNIEFLGRIDHQVKVRGFRIELAEIEQQLLKHEQIREAVVVAIDRAGEKCLCAYIVAQSDMTVADLRKFLEQKLPDYMIPSHFITLARMPLNSNGKIDRQALPVPEGDLAIQTAYAPPTNEIETKLAQIWQETLGVQRIGIQENFFELGGHSLQAMRLMLKIQKEFKVEASISTLFQAPTIKQMAEAVDLWAQKKNFSVKRAERNSFYPVSFSQKRMFIANQFAPDNIYYNSNIGFKIQGDLDEARLEKAFQALIRRHESLRTSFELNGDEVIQKVNDDCEFHLSYSACGEEGVERFIRQFIQPFDLSSAPLIRVGLAKPQDGENILIIDTHHIIMDAVSLDILIRELGELYAGKVLADLEVQYKDYAIRQRDTVAAGVLKNQETHWRGILNGPVPALNLPLDYPRPARKGHQGKSIFFNLSHKLTKELYALAAENGCTIYPALLSIYYILLSKYAGQEDMIIGVPVAGRNQAEFSNTIGVFINTLALRNYPQGHKSGREFFGEVKEQALKALENQDYPFELLVDQLDVPRDLNRNPLFEIMFDFLERPGLKLEGLEVTAYEIEEQGSSLDLVLEVIEQQGKIGFWLQYDPQLFKLETMEKFANDYIKLMTAFLNNPDLKINELEL